MNTLLAEILAQLGISVDQEIIINPHTIYSTSGLLVSLTDHGVRISSITEGPKDIYDLTLRAKIHKLLYDPDRVTTYLNEVMTNLISSHENDHPTDLDMEFRDNYVVIMSSPTDAYLIDGVKEQMFKNVENTWVHQQPPRNLSHFYDTLRASYTILGE